jgi:hypothetical protein
MEISLKSVAFDVQVVKTERYFKPDTKKNL